MQKTIAVGFGFIVSPAGDPGVLIDHIGRNTDVLFRPDFGHSFGERIGIGGQELLPRFTQFFFLDAEIDLIQKKALRKPDKGKAQNRQKKQGEQKLPFGAYPIVPFFFLLTAFFKKTPFRFTGWCQSDTPRRAALRYICCIPQGSGAGV